MIGQSIGGFPNIDQVRTFVLERVNVHFGVHNIDLLYPMLRSNMEFLTYLDTMTRTLSMELRSAAIKGEMTTETRMIEGTSSFEVFESWFDHLKYALKIGRVKGLGWAAPVFQNLKIRRIHLNKKYSVAVPVSMMKICPHADINWARDPVSHVRWVAPIKFGELNDRS